MRSLTLGRAARPVETAEFGGKPHPRAGIATFPFHVRWSDPVADCSRRTDDWSCLYGQPAQTAEGVGAATRANVDLSPQHNIPTAGGRRTRPG